MTTIDRPEDIANRDYYQNRIQFRRVRVTLEVDAEWSGDPDYTLDVAQLDIEQNLGSPRLHTQDPSIRVRRPQMCAAVFADDLIRDANGEPVLRIDADMAVCPESCPSCGTAEPTPHD